VLYFPCILDKELFEKLKQLSEKTMIPMSKLLDRGIELVLEEYEKPAK
jgi:predicted DNA-binding protein